MKVHIVLAALLCALVTSTSLLAQHTPERVLYRRTSDIPGNDFGGALPGNVDLELPFGEFDDGSSLVTNINIDREGSVGEGISLAGDNFDLVFVMQFYDADGVFSFTENFDDRVKVVATPIAGSTDLTETGASQEHSNTSWNTRTYGNYDFGAGGWFNANIWLTEDGGGAQSAADIGFGYFNGTSTNTADFGGIGYAGTYGVSSGVPAAFDTDDNGESWGVYVNVADLSIDTDGDSIPDAIEEVYFPGDLTQLGAGDFDDDGVNDPDEYVDGTDPTVADADNDGSNDGQEKAAGTDPANPDSDGDGLLDGVETGTGTLVSADDTGTNPLAADTDGDGLSDAAEIADENYDPNVDDSASDVDADGVTLSEELAAGTDPADDDSDDDTLLDGAELTAGTNPLSGDTDGDGLGDAVETGTGTLVDANDTGTDPTLADTDGDGASDAYEIDQGFDPNDANSTPPIPVVQPSFIPINEFVPGAYGPDLTQTGLNYQQNKYPGGVIFNNQAEGNYNAHVSGNPTPNSSFDAIVPWASHGNGGGQISNRNSAWLDGGGENFTVRINGYLDMSSFAPGTYNIHLGADDTNYFIMDTVDGQVLAQHNCCPQNQVTAFTITTPGMFPFDNVFGEQGGGDWYDVGISGPGINGIVALGDTERGSPPVYPVGINETDSDDDGLIDAWETLWDSIDDLTALSSDGDFDSDGFTDLAEYTAGTDPTDSDSDDDGLLDGAEATAGTDPTLADTDGDGLSDGAENTAGTDPTLADTDGDGLGDGQELAFGSDPLDAASLPVDPIVQPSFAPINALEAGVYGPDFATAGLDYQENKYPGGVIANGQSLNNYNVHLSGSPAPNSSVTAVQPWASHGGGGNFSTRNSPFVDGGGDNFTVRINGYLDMRGYDAGDYIIHLQSDDTNYFVMDTVDGTVIADDPNCCAERTQGFTITVPGLFPFDNVFGEQGGGEWYDVAISGPGIPGIVALGDTENGSPPVFVIGSEPVDTDDDGLFDAEESALGTDPTLADTDGDSLSDSVEVAGGTDPLVADTDNDGFSDGDEDALGSDPNNANSPTPQLAQHTPERVLYRRTDNIPGNDFGGALPGNVDIQVPFGELDDGSTLVTNINIDREGQVGEGLNLAGDNFDLVFVMQFYDEDGVFSFTENFDDRVKVVATPIAGSTDLTATGASQEHSNTGWNARTYGNYDFGAGGWFNANIWLTEDGGGAQSAADIGFGYFNGTSTNTADFGGIGYAGTFGVSSGAPAAFDTDANGESWGAYVNAADLSVDTDADSIPDAIEEVYFPGDLTQLGEGDLDQDGVSDADEYVDGTDPTVADADNDGSNDGEEKAAGTDPANPDTDGDGLLDGVETGTGTLVSADDTGTNPLAADSDGDGLSDGNELVLAAQAPVATAPANPGGTGESPEAAISLGRINPGVLSVDTGGSAVGDTELGLFAADGALLANNDDSVLGFQSIVQGDLAAGTYYLAAGAYNTLFGPIDFDAAAPAGVASSITVNLRLGGFDADSTIVATATGANEAGAVWFTAELAFAPTYDPNVDDSDSDFDADGSSLSAEVAAGTDPQDSDSDDDGLLDGAELTAGTNPLSSDTDGDGLGDAVETGTGTLVDANDTGTDPTLADTDGDGSSDAYEIDQGFDPNDANSTPPIPVVQPSFIPINEFVPNAYAPDLTQTGLNYQQNKYPGGVIFNNQAEGNYNAHVSGNPTPNSSFDAIVPWASHGNGGGQISNRNSAWLDGGGENFTVRINGYLDMSNFAPGTYNIHLGADDTNYFIMDTVDGQVTAQHNCCPQNQTTAFTITVPGIFPFDNVFGEQGGGDWYDVGISGPGINGIVALGDTENGSPPVYPIGIDTTDADADGLIDAWELSNTEIDDLDALAGTLANSVTGFSNVQGQDGWQHGYRNFTLDGGGTDYEPGDFIQFPEDAWREAQSQWRLAPSAAPWTTLAAENTHPNGTNSAPNEEHWTVRRWTADADENVIINWTTRKVNPNNDGVTGAVHVNGVRVDSATIAGNDTAGVSRTLAASISAGDVIDLVLTPQGLTSNIDGSDGSANSMTIEGDFDGDGSSDLAEYTAGTDPTNSDSDDDGLSDGAEVAAGTDPANADTDGDGLSDGEEATAGTDPTLADTDGDGLGDARELVFGSDPLDAASLPVDPIVQPSFAPINAQDSGIYGPDFTAPGLDYQENKYPGGVIANGQSLNNYNVHLSGSPAPNSSVTAVQPWASHGGGGNFSTRNSPFVDGGGDNFTVRINGYLDMRGYDAGDYTIHLQSDDTNYFVMDTVDGTVIADDPNCCAERTQGFTISVAGLFPFDNVFGEQGGGEWYDVAISGPGIPGIVALGDTENGSPPVYVIGGETVISNTLIAVDATNLNLADGEVVAGLTNAGTAGDFSTLIGTVETASHPANNGLGATVQGLAFDGDKMVSANGLADTTMTGNQSYSVTAWVWNPAFGAEEAIVSWGTRGGPAGSNSGFHQGNNPTFGAIGHWGPPDTGWGPEGVGTDINATVGQWAHLAYTWDGTTERVYINGALSNSEDHIPLNPHQSHADGTPTLFAIGSENDSANANSTPIPFSGTIARITALDAAITANMIQAEFDAESPLFFEGISANDLDGDGIADSAETNTGIFVDATDTGTDPNNSDSDADGFGDGAEVAAGTDPNDANSPAPLAPGHVAERVLYRRTDNIPGNDFGGALPGNIDIQAPFGELDDGSSLVTNINIDREGSVGEGISLAGDNFDLVFVMQFYDEDGVFSFTENFDDRVKVVATPIAGSTDLTETGASQEHSNTSWNTRTFGNYDFGAGGWFNANIWLTEDGGGAQSAADIGFGYFNGTSTNTADFGGIGYAGTFGVSSGAPAAFDTDANGESWGAYVVTYNPSRDTDADGLPDGYEELFFPGDLTQLGAGDLDSDGVSDVDEYADGTDPTDPDADDDGSDDGQEKAAGTDPANPDTDGDGLLDGVETGTGTLVSTDDTGTNPLAADSDGDGLSDGNELVLAAEAPVATAPSNPGGTGESPEQAISLGRINPGALSFDTGGSAVGDTELGLFAADGALLANNDDSELGLQSRVGEDLAAGTYYLAAGAYNSFYGTNFQVSAPLGVTNSLTVNVRLAPFAIDNEIVATATGVNTTGAVWFTAELGGTYDPNVDDSDSDFDADGSSLSVELAAGSDPQDSDSDDDGLLDGAEATAGTNPLSGDTDGDGLGDAVETGTGTFVDANDTGTDPTLADTDGDGSSDAYEIDQGFDPNDANSTPPIPVVQPSFIPINEFVPNAYAPDLTQTGLNYQQNKYPGGVIFNNQAEGNYNAHVSGNPTPNSSFDAIVPWASHGNGGGQISNRNSAWLDGGGENFTVRINGYLDMSNFAPGTYNIHLGADDTNYFIMDTVDGQVTAQHNCCPQNQVTAFTITTPGMFPFDNVFGEQGGGDWYDVGISGPGINGIVALGDTENGSPVVYPIGISTEDSDEDGLIDAWETLWPGIDDLTALTSDGDFDSDGSTDGEEYTAGTDPTNDDSDGDGLLDGAEATAGTDPANADTDGDGLSDGEESTETGTDPLDADTDGDGLADGQELTFGSDPLDAASLPVDPVVQPSFVPINAQESGVYGPDFTTPGVDYQENKYPGGVIANGQSLNNYNVHVSGSPAPNSSVTAVQPWTSHGGGGNFSTRNSPFVDGGGDNFTVRYNGYLDMRGYDAGEYTIHLQSDDTNYFVMDTVDGTVIADDPSCCAERTQAFTISIPGVFPFDNVFGEQGGGEWTDVAISGPGIPGIVALGDTENGSPPVYVIGSAEQPPAERLVNVFFDENGAGNLTLENLTPGETYHVQGSFDGVNFVALAGSEFVTPAADVTVGPLVLPFTTEQQPLLLVKVYEGPIE